jgi:orotidine-5'-phosphate decarboxylase
MAATLLKRAETILRRNAPGATFKGETLRRGTMRLQHRVIAALDELQPERARVIASQVRPHVDAVKVGWALFLAGGRELLADLARDGYVLGDFRTAEIPNTTRLIVEQVVRFDVSGIITQGFVGEDSVRAAVDAARGRDVFVITEMSHPGGAQFTAPHAEEMARIAVRAGATGIVAPATRPERVKLLRGLVGDRLILSPGVGAQGGKAVDAIRAGADAVIVGRSIYEAADPAKAAAEIAAEIGAR